MTARNPEDLDRMFGEALNAGDLAALLALYEPRAALMPSPGQPVTGTNAIRAALGQFVAMKPAISISARVLLQSDDVALMTSSWKLDMTGPDGKPASASGQGIEVARRRPDGTWLYAIDAPFGLAT